MYYPRPINSSSLICLVLILKTIHCLKFSTSLLYIMKLIKLNEKTAKTERLFKFCMKQYQVLTFYVATIVIVNAIFYQYNINKLDVKYT